MTLTIELDLHRVKVKPPFQMVRSHFSQMLLSKHTDTHTADRLLYAGN